MRAQPARQPSVGRTCWEGCCRLGCHARLVLLCQLQLAFQQVCGHLWADRCGIGRRQNLPRLHESACTRADPHQGPASFEAQHARPEAACRTAPQQTCFHIHAHTRVDAASSQTHTHTHTCPKSDLCRYSPAPAPALASALTGLRAAAAAAASLFSSTKSLAVLRSPAEPSELLLLGCWCCCLPPEAPAPAVAGQEATQAWRDVRMCECARHTVLAGRRRAARNGRPHPVCSHLHAGCLLLTVCAGRLLLLRCARPAAVLSAVR